MSALSAAEQSPASGLSLIKLILSLLVTMTNWNERVKKRNGRNHVILNRKKQME